MARDTIFALASGRSPAGVAVIRISGPGAGAVLEALSARPIPAPRNAIVRTLYDSTNGDIIDRGIVIYFPAPHSYTGENIVEIQCHGGSAVVASVLASLARFEGVRRAEPGEFTRRAVENGRLDLVQAEAVADLVAAETEGQRQIAQAQFGGALSALYERWRAELIRASAWIEASIDFPDEDLPAGVTIESGAALRVLLQEMRAHLRDGRRGEILRGGYRVAIIGPPNVGKSSLLNALARRDAAIVSELPGTTRDVIEVRLDLGGIPVILADTAGIRTASDAIEVEGMRRAIATAEAADLRLLVRDGSALMPADAILEDQMWGGFQSGNDIVVWNKADLVSKPTGAGLWISARDGTGLQELIAAIATRANTAPVREGPLLTRARHREAIENAAKNLEYAVAAPAQAQELAAEDLRRAIREIGRITGRVDLDELLDVIFRDFCIGK